jgi:hypothetical protein
MWEWLRRKPKKIKPVEIEIPDFILSRYETGDHGTFGLWSSTSADFSMHIIELPWRDNKPNFSCIPVGIYKVCKYESKRFGRCWQVMDVEGRTYILIHPGNLAGDRDKGYSSHLRGCMSPGRRRGWLTGKTGKKQKAVCLSRPAMNDFMNYHGWEPFTLKITEVF